MSEVLYSAIPVFLLLLIAEAASFRHVGDDEDLVGYDLRDGPGPLTLENLVLLAVGTSERP